MFQTIAVITLVVGALLYAVRRVVRTLHGKEDCGCGCPNCPMKDSVGCHCNGKDMPR